MSIAGSGVQFERSRRPMAGRVLALSAALSVILGGTSQGHAATFGDVNCDGEADVVDVQLSIFAALGAGLPETFDGDGDGQIDLCAAGEDTSGLVPWCELSGEAGDTVDCLVRVARATEGSPMIGAVQFSLEFDNDAVELEQKVGQFCFDDVCFKLDDESDPVDPLFGFSDDHPLSEYATAVKASDLGNIISMENCGPVGWEPGTCESAGDCAGGAQCVEGTCVGSGGEVSVLVVRVAPSGFGGGLDGALSFAYRADSGEIVGNADIQYFRFRLLQDIEPEEPLYVNLRQVKAADTEAGPLAVELESDVLIASPVAAGEPRPFFSQLPGDLNNDGVRDVLDAQCYVFAWNSFGDPDALSTGCMGISHSEAELVCTETTGVVDILSIQRAAILAHYDRCPTADVSDWLQSNYSDWSGAACE